MKLFVYPNLLSFKQIETTREVISTLVNKLHHEVSISKEDSYKVYGSEEFFSFDVKDCDYIISLGGDACVLKTAQFAFKFSKPLLGINAGHLGYLCALKKEDIESLTDEKIKSFSVNELTVINLLYKDNIYYAFNEVVIGKMNFGKIITVDYQINSEEPVSYKGDGLIISTPLGSTGYSYSAGGEKLNIKDHMFAVTPICPHFLSTKAKTVKDNAIISINSPFSYENKTGVYLDGNYIGELKEMLSISKNKKKLLLLKNI